MRRRELLAGVAGASVVAAGGAVALGAGDRLDEALGDADEEPEEPIEVRTIDAPGSEAGTLSVPDPGRVTFVDFFATWCAPCEEQMPSLAAANDRVADDVQFVSVTPEPATDEEVRREIVSWWEEHDGSWTVASDPTSELGARYEATGYPTAIAFDDEGIVRWRHRGLASADDLVDGIEEAIEASGGS